MSAGLDKFSISQASEVFKINYDKKSENLYNSQNVLDGRIKKRYDFTGSEMSILNPLSFAGGVGAGRLPVSGVASYKQARITAKRMYATCQVEREAIYASQNDQGAFVRATAETVKKTVESFVRNSSRALFGDGSAVLGSGNATGTAVSGAGSVPSPYIVTFPAGLPYWKESNWEENDYVQMVVAGTSEGGDTTANLLQVVAVNPTLRQVSLVGTSARLAALVTGTLPLAATDKICMQRSYNVDPLGFKSIIDASVAGSGTLYNIPVQRRWQMTVKDAAGAGITTDRINEVMLEVERKSGQTPNMIMCSYAQYRNLLALMEDQKRYVLPNRNVKGNLSFSGVEYMSTKGALGIFVDRFADDDKVYMLNDNYITRTHRPGMGWFTDDKTVFLRNQDEDAYSARYGGYYENYIVPTFHGVVSGLAI